MGNVPAGPLDQGAAQGAMVGLRLLRGGGLAGADRPDRLISDRHIGDLGAVKSFKAGHQLRGQDLGSIAGFALRQGLAHAQERQEAVAQGSLDLLVDQLVGLAKDVAALGMAQNHAGDPVCLEHRGGDFAGKRALVLEVHVLRAQCDGGAGQFLGDGRNQDRGRRDHDLTILAQLRKLGVELGPDRLDQLAGLHRSEVHLPVGCK